MAKMTSIRRLNSGKQKKDRSEQKMNKAAGRGCVHSRAAVRLGFLWLFLGAFFVVVGDGALLLLLLPLRLGTRRRRILLVGSLEDVLVIPLLHEELSEMVLAVEHSVQCSIRCMRQWTPSMCTLEAWPVVRFPLHSHLQPDSARLVSSRDDDRLVSSRDDDISAVCKTLKKRNEFTFSRG